MRLRASGPAHVRLILRSGPQESKCAIFSPRLGTKQTELASGTHTTVKPDIAVSLAQAQAIVDRLGDVQTVAQVSELHGGDIGAIYEIGLVDGAPSLVLKVYPESLHWKMRKEVNVCTLLSGRLSTAVPRILLADDAKSLIGLNFVLMSKLDGAVLRTLEPALADTELFSAYSQMGEVLREIHGISMQSFGYIGPDGVWTPHASNRAYMSFQFDKKLTEFAGRGGDPALGDRLAAVVRERAYLLDACPTAHLCHYDFHSGNILAEGSGGSLRLSGVLDFEGAIAGDPLMDIAKALYYFAAKDEPKKAGLLAGYGAIERGDWQETLGLYRLYGTLELWCWMAQIGNHEPLARLAEDLRISTRC
jgi:aminoglycoside phosphotransferase (APT) family kinase protein